jgi:molecular chaperone Hsp33
MVAMAENYHQSSAVVTAAMGRLLTAASMMGIMQKNPEDTVTLRISGSGPIGFMIAVSDAQGNARVAVENAVVEIPSKKQGKLDVAKAVGSKGTLTVIKDSGKGEPQIGICALASGEIAEDIAKYFAESEQIPTVCALGVLVDADLSVLASGGLLLQLLPGADDDTITQLEKNMAVMPPVSSMIYKEKTPLQILETALQGFAVEIIEEANVVYRCNCSRERAERVMASIGREELLKLASEENDTIVECHFCDKRYSFTSEQLCAL